MICCLPSLFIIIDDGVLLRATHLDEERGAEISPTLLHDRTSFATTVPINSLLERLRMKIALRVRWSEKVRLDCFLRVEVAGGKVKLERIK